MPREVLFEGEPPREARVAIAIAELMVAIQIKHPEYDAPEISNIIVTALTRMKDMVLTEAAVENAPKAPPE